MKSLERNKTRITDPQAPALFCLFHTGTLHRTIKTLALSLKITVTDQIKVTNS